MEIYFHVTIIRYNYLHAVTMEALFIKLQNFLKKKE